MASKADQEKLKAINQNLKTFFDSLKAALEKQEDEVFNDDVNEKWTVKQAKHAHKQHELFKWIINKMQGTDMAMVMKA